MDSNRKRRGFMKGKLMPFYRAAKPSSTTSTMQYSSNVKPSLQVSTSPAYSVGYMVHQQQDYVIAAQPKQKISFIVPADHSSLKKQFDHSHNVYGAGAAGDEAVDMKAATYISAVQERFKLERSINS